VFVASSGGRVLPQFIKEGVNFIPIPIKTKQEISPKIFLSLLKLSGRVKKHNIDIIHANSRTTQVLGYLLAKKCKKAYVSTCHGFFKKRLFRKMFPCWGLKVIAISESVKDHLMRDFGVAQNRIAVIHNGIDVDKARSLELGARRETKKRFGLKDGPVVGIVARLSDVKGHIYLIEAMRTVIDKLGDAQLLIVGEGRMKKELLDLTNNLGISDKVLFFPEVDDTQEVLSVMDIFVMPSLKEGLGLALMEAMAQGVAVIGSDVGGIKSLIQHGHNGLLVKAADTGGLACAMIELLRDSQKRQALARQAQIFIEQNFSQDKMVLETEKVYAQCLS